jgi:hypothetical protein
MRNINKVNNFIQSKVVVKKIILYLGGCFYDYILSVRTSAN